jgi:hypothetical protein
MVGIAQSLFPKAARGAATVRERFVEPFRPRSLTIAACHSRCFCFLMDSIE